MNNRQVIGKLLIVCKRLNFSKEATSKLLSEMYVLLETKSEEDEEIVEEGFQWFLNLEQSGESSKKEVKKNNRNLNPRNSVKHRGITRLPDSIESRLAKKNKELIEFLRSL